MQRSTVLFGVSVTVFTLIYGMQSRENLQSFSSRLPLSDDLFSISAYKSDCLWLMEEDNIPIRSVGSYAVEMYTGQERHLCLSLQLCALQFLLTILTKFLRVFRCFRGNQCIAESFDLVKMSNDIKVF